MHRTYKVVEISTSVSPLKSRWALPPWGNSATRLSISSLKRRNISALVLVKATKPLLREMAQIMLDILDCGILPETPRIQCEVEDWPRHGRPGPPSFQIVEDNSVLIKVRTNKRILLASSRGSKNENRDSVFDSFFRTKYRFLLRNVCNYVF